MNNVTGLEARNGSVNLGIGACKVALYTEAVLSAVLGKSNVDIVTGLAILKLNSNNGERVEVCKLILEVDKLLGAEVIGKVNRLCNVGIAINEAEGCVHNLNLACPCALVALYSNLGAGDKLCRILLGASKLVNEVRAILVCRINGDLVIPPGLSCLNVCLDVNGRVKLCCRILLVGHKRKILKGIFIGLLKLGLALVANVVAVSIYVLGAGVSYVKAGNKANAHKNTNQEN